MFNLLQTPHVEAMRKDKVFTSSIDNFLPGLGLQHSVMGVEGLTDHEDDHGHRQDP